MIDRRNATSSAWLKFLPILSLLFAACCTEKFEFDNPSHYSNSGFDRGRRADDATNTIPNLTPTSASKINAVSPGYYTDNNPDFSSQGAVDAMTKTPIPPGQPAPTQAYYQGSPQGYYVQQPQGYYQQPQPAPGYYVQQPYAVPYQQQPQMVPNSRFYSNPYALPPQNYPPQYYQDSDQYYKAPNYYTNTP